MKRAKRIRLTGRIDGKRRRRIAKMLRRASGDGCPFYRAAWEKRDGRRLAEAGLASVAITKSWWGVGPMKEFTLFHDHTEARRRYPRRVPSRGRTWTARKRPKRGSARRAAKRRWRATMARLDRA